MDPAVAVCVDVQNVLVNEALLNWGTPDQKERYLPALASDTVAAFAISEAEAGSDAFALATRAEPDGDDFLLNGRKLWTTNGAEAGLYLLFASIDPAKQRRGITAFLVERATPGFSVGKRENKLGLRACSTCELVLDGVRVSKRQILGQPCGGTHPGDGQP